MDELRAIKKVLKKKNDTRWNSIYMMLKAFVKLTPHEIDTILVRGITTRGTKGDNERKLARENNLSEDEREQIEELITILHELFVFTNIIQG